MKKTFQCMLSVLLSVEALALPLIDLSGSYSFRKQDLRCRSDDEITFPGDGLAVFRYLGDYQDRLDIALTTSGYLITRNEGRPVFYQQQSLTVPDTEEWIEITKHLRRKFKVEGETLTIIDQDREIGGGCWGVLCGATLGIQRKWQIRKVDDGLAMHSRYFRLDFLGPIPKPEIYRVDCIAPSLTSQK